jgi:hypothetical protein
LGESNVQSLPCIGISGEKFFSSGKVREKYCREKLIFQGEENISGRKKKPGTC